LAPGLSTTNCLLNPDVLRSIVLPYKYFKLTLSITERGLSQNCISSSSILSVVENSYSKPEHPPPPTANLKYSPVSNISDMYIFAFDVIIGNFPLTSLLNIGTLP
jgi:hypothetical protein